MSATESIDIRAVQYAPTLGEVAANEERIADALRSADDDGVDLVVFPELALTGYYIGSDDAERLTEAATEALDRLASVAPDVTAVIGAPVRQGDDRYNAAAVLDDGSTSGVYAKTHLYADESSVFDVGEQYPIFETGAGRIGVEICYDLEFPEVARQLALGGADLLVTISANMRPFVVDQRAYHRARALENVRPHVLCNRIGTERNAEFFGRSGIVDERGRDVVTAGEDRDITVTGTVSLGGDGADTLQYLSDRRPETYTRD